MTQEEKELKAPNFWKLVKVWNENPNHPEIEQLMMELTKEEKEYFNLHKIFKETLGI